MPSDSNSQFKLFRILWFPLSINAMVLGTLCLLAFMALTWIGCLVIGDQSLALSATKAFIPSTRSLVTRGHWPGYATKEEDGRNVHYLLASEDPTVEERRLAQEERSLMNALFSGFLAEGMIEARAAEESSAEAVREFENHASRVLPRYRWVYGLQLLGVLFIWSTLGVALCRLLAIRIARDEYCPIGEALKYGWSVKLTGLLYPLAVLLPLILLAIMNQAAGWLTSIPYLGALLAVPLTPLAIISTMVIVLCCTVGIFCFGLMPAAIAVERKGTYDCLGKSFNYIFARPLPVILHVFTIATFVGLIITIFHEYDAMRRVLSWTMTPMFLSDSAEAMIMGEPDSLSGGQWLCAWVFRVFHVLFRLLLDGAILSLIAGALTALYLVLRKDVDGVGTADLAAQPRVAPPAPAPAKPVPEEPSEDS